MVPVTFSSTFSKPWTQKEVETHKSDQIIPRESAGHSSRLWTRELCGNWEHRGWDPGVSVFCQSGRSYRPPSPCPPLLQWTLLLCYSVTLLLWYSDTLLLCYSARGRNPLTGGVSSRGGSDWLTGQPWPGRPSKLGMSGWSHCYHSLLLTATAITTKTPTHILVF